MRTVEDDRQLCNWLSTRIVPRGDGLLDGWQCHPDNTFEAEMVEHRIAYAAALGLTLAQDAYIAPGTMTHTPKQLDFIVFLADRLKRLKHTQQHKRAS